jgi:Spy/CpxP family protein refolding chaperone
MQVTLVAAVVAMTAGSALAQERQRQRPGGGFGGFGGGTLFLLGQKSVQEELKLSDEQIKKVQELAQAQRSNRGDFQGLGREEIQKKLAERAKAQNEALAKILDAKQLKRAKQIALQQQTRFGLGFALNNEEVAKSLNITDEQKEKIRQIQGKVREEMQGVGFDEQGRKKREEVMKAANERMESVLTAEQKTKLKEMQGEPFKGEIQRPQFGAGRRNRQN